MDMLLHLPTEIQHCIFGYLTTNADRRRVALTCQDLHAVAISHIYHSITVHLSQLTALVDCFHSGNPGLSHVRHVRINDEQREYNQMRHGPSLIQLVKLLPHDNLETFELATTQPVSGEYTNLLASRQCHLKNHHLHPRTYGDTSAEVRAGTEAFRDARSICLNIRNLGDCRRGAELIRNARFLTALSIDLDYVDDGTDSKTSGLGSSAISLTVLEALLTPTDGEVSVLKRPLKRLQLKRLDLASAGELLPNLLDFSSLDELSLVSCVHTSRLLATINETSLQLRHFTNERACDDDTDRQGTLNSLLQSFTGLQTLRISSDVCSAIYADCDWKALEHHSSTIRSLLVDDSKREQFPFMELNHDRGIAAFDALCSKCPQLSELAIRCPSFETKEWERANGFQAFLNSLKRLPSLTVLRLLAYPEEKKADCKEMCDNEQKAEMQRLATQIFTLLQSHCPRLAVVAIDARKQHQDCRSTRYVDRYAFIRRQSNKSRVRPVDLRRLKHHEPGCDAILHDVLW